ncbi:NUDIX domain-containing protein [Demequina flava]|uniref:NUDIX domain-containing protein n=1 Tax=Demequina flava TaxID=1095025 RepID=UPI0007810B3F|nr:NUDIX hydrolase [Demequina flava]
MSVPHDPRSAIPPALGGTRDPGDAWVVAADGTKYWGRFGAAGLVAVDPTRGVLLQHRATWSHHGGTWGIPGGALHQGETALTGALREAHEEAGVPLSAIRPRLTWVADMGVWSYTTVIADVTTPFEPAIGDAESIALEWVSVEELSLDRATGRRPLHPALEAGTHGLFEAMNRRPHIVIDAANVVGSTLDGWWKDRQGATQRLVDSLAHLSVRGLAAESLNFPGSTWFPPISVVTEGKARGVRGHAEVNIVEAPGEGDDAVVELVTALRAQGEEPLVVTSDRELQTRVHAADGVARSVRWIQDQLS